MISTYRSVAGRIRQELPAVAQVAIRASGSLDAATSSGDDRYIDAVALNLHAFYSGLEHLFEQIARRIDESMPSGASWHQDLLIQMASPMSDVRPPVISGDLRDRLDRYRGFRHVVRNVYTYNLDSGQVALLVRALPETSTKVASELAAFADFLEEAARA